MNRSRRRERLISLALLVTVVVLTFIRPEQAPPIWYDEGRTLTLAQNWIENDHYRLYLIDEPVPASILTRGVSAVAPVALSFRIFGVGIWQGRLAGRIMFVLLLLIFYSLVSAIEDKMTAIASIALVCFFHTNSGPEPYFFCSPGTGGNPRHLVPASWISALTPYIKEDSVLRPGCAFLRIGATSQAADGPFLSFLISAFGSHIRHPSRERYMPETVRRSRIWARCLCYFGYHQERTFAHTVFTGMGG